MARRDAMPSPTAIPRPAGRAATSPCRRKRAQSEEVGPCRRRQRMLQILSSSTGPGSAPASWCALGYLLAQPVAGHHRAPRGERALLFRRQGTRAGAWPVRAAADRRVGVSGRRRADEHRGGRRDRDCCCCVNTTHIELFPCTRPGSSRTEIGRYLRLTGPCWGMDDFPATSSIHTTVTFPTCGIATIRHPRR